MASITAIGQASFPYRHYACKKPAPHRCARNGAAPLADTDQNYNSGADSDRPQHASRWPTRRLDPHRPARARRRHAGTRAMAVGLPKLRNSGGPPVFHHQWLHHQPLADQRAGITGAHRSHRLLVETRLAHPAAFHCRLRGHRSGSAIRAAAMVVAILCRRNHLYQGYALVRRRLVLRSLLEFGRRRAILPALAYVSCLHCRTAQCAVRLHRRRRPEPFTGPDERTQAARLAKRAAIRPLSGSPQLVRRPCQSTRPALASALHAMCAGRASGGLVRRQPRGSCLPS